MIEAKEMVVDTCNKVIENYANKHGVQLDNLQIRIDMENTVSKPVFGIFNNSTFLQRATLKQVVRASGGGALSMIISMSVQNIIKDIFVQSLKQLELSDSKRIFLILQATKNEDGITPQLSLYQDKALKWSLDVTEIMDVTLTQAKDLK